MQFSGNISLFDIQPLTFVNGDINVFTYFIVVLKEEKTESLLFFSYFVLILASGLACLVDDADPNYNRLTNIVFVCILFVSIVTVVFFVLTTLNYYELLPVLR